MGWVSGLIGQRTFKFWALAAVLVVSMAALAGGMAYGTTSNTADNCDNPPGSPPSSPLETLNGSAFEIDSNANQVVDESGCIDWLDTSTEPGTQQGAVVKQDKFSDPTDESFTQGTKEDTASPVIEAGSIPPNKSDLKAFGVFTEAGQATVTPANPTGKFLELLWTRVQEPKEDPKSPPGTTNMDFELNQKYCDPTKPPNATTNPCAQNGVTPLRTGDGGGPLTDDKLITYDLSKGGTVATMSIRSWGGSAWGSPTVLSQQSSATALALGTVNTSQITAANSLASLNPPLDPRTFGEASLSFSALFGTTNTCGQFGSAYLKSRSSDQFNAALKDFVPPAQVSISNCSTLSTTPNPSSGTVGVTLNDSATLSGASNPSGNIEFKLWGPDNPTCDLAVEAAKFTQSVALSGNSASTTGGHQTTQTGTYRWTATYAGDSNNNAAESGCQAEQVVVSAAQSTIETAQELTPQDSVTLDATAGGTPTEKVHFYLYGPDNPTCDPNGADPVYTEENVGLNNGSAETSNETFSVSSASDDVYHWKVVYDGDSAHEGITSDCTENFTLTIDNGA